MPPGAKKIASPFEGFPDLHNADDVKKLYTHKVPKKAVELFTVHIMGTARMGRDPRTSVLNQWNQVHAVPNVFVTDGACMTSTGTQNPTLTYMAITARAANHAVDEINKKNL